MFCLATRQLFLTNLFSVVVTTAMIGAMTTATTASCQLSRNIVPSMATAVMRSATTPIIPEETSFLSASASLVTLETSFPVLPYSKKFWLSFSRWRKKSVLMSAMMLSPSLFR